MKITKPTNLLKPMKLGELAYGEFFVLYKEPSEDVYMKSNDSASLKMAYERIPSPRFSKDTEIIPVDVELVCSFPDGNDMKRFKAIQ